MGFNVSTFSDIEMLDGTNPKALELRKCDNDKLINRRYYWFLEEYLFNKSESILTQLEKLLHIHISWLGDIIHLEEFDENLSARFLSIDNYFPKLINLEKCLQNGIDVIGKFSFASDMSAVNREYYPNYVQNGDLLDDIQILVQILECYQKNGANSFLMYYG